MDPNSGPKGGGWGKVNSRRKTTMPLNLTETAKSLRTNSTDAERLLWSRLRAKQLCGCKFRRQEQIGRFIVDFVCYERQLVIEADGGQHAQELEKDEERTAWLNSQDFTVLRFWNHEVLTNPDGVIETIMGYLA
jgi:very-short-patch-repair endonuclease